MSLGGGWDKDLRFADDDCGNVGMRAPSVRGVRVGRAAGVLRDEGLAWLAREGVLDLDGDKRGSMSLDEDLRMLRGDRRGLPGESAPEAMRAILVAALGSLTTYRGELR